MSLVHRLRDASIAALLATAATVCTAQFDYSAYGLLDFSYGRFEPSGQLREHRFNSSSMAASFVGANARYGLDNGWTPGITLETFIRFEDMQTGRNERDPLLSRNAFVSLAHKDYGLLRAGRLQSFLFDTTKRFNALGNSPAFSPALRHVFLAGNLLGVQGDFYWDSAVSYATPSIEGVSVNAMYGRGPSDRRGHYAGASAIVARGLFAASISAQRVRIDDLVNDPTAENTWQIGATYDFGVARVFGLYTETDDRGLDVRSRLGSVGTVIAVGPGNVQMQIGVGRASGPAVNRRQTSSAAAYVYSFDSRTDFYAAAMDDRVRRQTRGLSAAVGVQFRF